jgi:endoglucanase
VSSTSVTVAWTAPDGASEADVWIGPEPFGDESVRLRKRVPASAGREIIDGLPPDVDLFVRVGVGGRSATLHVRTPPRDPASDDPVSAVYLVAPDVLAIALWGEPGDGEHWQRDDWDIQRWDESSLAVRSVSRWSVPVAQPSYAVGPGGENDLDDVVAEHRVYLRLVEAVGSSEMLRVRGPNDLDLLVPVSDRYLETPVVQLNQVGMSPRARHRWAYVSGWTGDGGPLDLSGFPAEVEVVRTSAGAAREVVATLPLVVRSSDDEDAGTAVREVDLASLAPTDGALRIRVPGVGVSYATHLDERSVFRAFYITARGVFHQRWGAELSPRDTDWPRPADHGVVFTADQDDALSMFPEGTPRTGRRELRGGYHDAGDFDQRPSHTVVPQLLMRAYEHDPARFGDAQLALPESDDGIPDLLNEALWGVAGWEQLQESDGGVRAGVESHQHPPGIYFASDDPLPYWTYARSPHVTARAAGLFAQAAHLVARFDAARAAALRGRAERAFAWARAHDGSPYALLYAAGELYRLTGEERYRETFERTWRALGPMGGFQRYSRDQLALAEFTEEGRLMGDWVIAYATNPRADSQIRDAIFAGLERAADGAADGILDSSYAHRNCRIYPDGIDWGRATVMGRCLDPIFSRLALGELSADRRQRYFDAISVAADYVLGANPLGMSFITGLGSRQPRRPLHLDSLVWVSRGRPPVPGIPVFGPVKDAPGAAYYRPALAAFHPAFGEQPRVLRYADVRSFVSTNECTIWECQAPHVEHFAALVAPDSSPPDDWLPRGRRAQPENTPAPE